MGKTDTGVQYLRFPAHAQVAYVSGIVRLLSSGLNRFPVAEYDVLSIAMQQGSRHDRLPYVCICPGNEQSSHLSCTDDS